MLRKHSFKILPICKYNIIIHHIMLKKFICKKILFLEILLKDRVKIIKTYNIH